MESNNAPVVLLSYGMGVESSTILARWIYAPDTRPCPLEELIVVTSQVGDEHLDSGRDVETHILPLMRANNIRYVQVARRGHFEADGIVVLDDSRNPQQVFLEGHYKLSEELARNGTVPQYGGVHWCALKFKAWVIERWLDENIRCRARHAFGYNADERQRIVRREYAFAERIAFGFNADERGRISRSCEYNTVTREAFYPLLEWGWDRQRCLEYLRAVFGVTWKKSACVYCPFLALNESAIERHKEHPSQVADAMMLEYVSLAMNPRGTLYKEKSLIEIARKTGNTDAIQEFERRLRYSRWALYRVRRVYSAKGRADRAVEKLARFGTLEDALEVLRRLAARSGLELEEKRGLSYAWRERRSEGDYPTREELFTVAPDSVETKARYGLDWFEQRWAALQMNLLFSS